MAKVPSSAFLRRRTLFFLCYGALAAAALALVVVQRARLPQQPFIDADIWGYLHPALAELTGRGFQHTAGRDFLYPGFVYLVLRVFGDFRAVTAIQHTLGVLTGGLMLWSWERLGQLLGRGRPPSAAARWLGLLAAATYVSARSALLMEHTVRPEAIFPFCVFLSILINLEFITRRWVSHQPVAAAWLGGAGMIVSVALYHLKPSFGVTIFFANLPLLLSLGWPGMTPRHKLAMAGGGALLAALLLVLPETLLRRSDPHTAAFLPNTLLTIHADLIRDQLAEDLASGQPLPYPRDQLVALHDRLSALIATSERPENNPYRSLGFNPDYLLYTDYVFNGLVPSEHPKLDPAVRQLCFYYYRRTALQHPGRMLGKICRQLGIFYNFHGLMPDHWLDTADPFRGQKEIPVGRGYAESIPSLKYRPFQNAIALYPPARRFETETERLVASPAVLSQPPLLSIALNVLTVLYLPVLIGWLAAVGCALARPARRERWRLPAGVLLLVCSYNFGNSLTIAIVHSLDVDRYVSNQLAFTLFSSAAGLWCLGLIVREEIIPTLAKSRSPDIQRVP